VFQPDRGRAAANGRAPIRVLARITSLRPAEQNDLGYVHEAFLYRGQRDFLDNSVPFIAGAVAAGAPVLVAVSAEKIEALRDELGPDARRVEFVLMTDAGRNPGRVIAMWRDFVDQAGGTPSFGIGEPVWSERAADELVECQQHEHLLNHAFPRLTRFHLRCPYDTATLDSAVLDEAIRSHPWLSGTPSNPDYAAIDGSSLLQAPLDPAPPQAVRLAVTAADLAALRHAVAREAAEAGVPTARRHDAVLVASELATNALRHGTDPCTLAVWSSGTHLTVEVHDDGGLDDPLVGRRRPDPGSARGRGLWLAHEFADLVQVRSAPGAGTTVRALFRIEP
jgi:anti-sigma regulatory factor (Ser/Thr protein kinase)